MVTSSEARRRSARVLPGTQLTRLQHADPDADDDAAAAAAAAAFSVSLYGQRMGPVKWQPDLFIVAFNHRADRDRRTKMHY